MCRCNRSSAHVCLGRQCKHSSNHSVLTPSGPLTPQRNSKYICAWWSHPALIAICCSQRQNARHTAFKEFHDETDIQLRKNDRQLNSMRHWIITDDCPWKYINYVLPQSHTNLLKLTFLHQLCSASHIRVKCSWTRAIMSWSTAMTETSTKRLFKSWTSWEFYLWQAFESSSALKAYLSCWNFKQPPVWALDDVIDPSFPPR